jgi:uncharacterized protein
MKSVSIRFYEELNDFLPKEKRKKKFKHFFIDRTSVKDLVESLGVPHTEIDLILVDGISVDFTFKINDGNEISVYPVFESFDISSLQKLRPEPLRDPKFVIDVQLGNLARNLRMLGFDSKYQNDFSEDDIVNISLKEKRTILTKNRNLLKRRVITHGYWVRNIAPINQLAEVINQFDLKEQLKEFTRCLDCNSIIQRIDKSEIENKIPKKVKLYFEEFFICTGCGKIYWPGSHYTKMKEKINKIFEDS